MGMLRAGLAVAALFIGAIAAFLGTVIVFSALKSGSIQFSYGIGVGAVTETGSRAVDTAHYWRLVAGLGLAPAIVGALTARWGWHAINR